MTRQARASNLDRNYCQKCGAEIASAVHSGDDGCMCDVESGGDLLRCCTRCHDIYHTQSTQNKGEPRISWRKRRSDLTREYVNEICPSCNATSGRFTVLGRIEDWMHLQCDHCEQHAKSPVTDAERYDIPIMPTVKMEERQDA